MSAFGGEADITVPYPFPIAINFVENCPGLGFRDGRLGAFPGVGGQNRGVALDNILQEAYVLFMFYR